MIGNFIQFKEDVLGVNNETRKHLITLFEDLNAHKNYKEDTLFMATSIADRFLVNLAVRDEPSPCLIKLTVVCTLLAAKLEQPLQPSFNRMLRFVD